MSGCVIFLIDESAAMASPMVKRPEFIGVPTGASGDPVKTKAESVATAINALLGKLSNVPDVEIALVGYSTDVEGQAQVEGRWGGSLAGRTFVKSSELAAGTLRVEERIRRIPDALGMMQEKATSFAVWYEPNRGDKAPQIAAFSEVQRCLSEWASTAPADAAAPLVVHLFSGSSADGNPLQAVKKVQELANLSSPPLVFQVHLSSSPMVPPTLYPANRAYLPVGPSRDLFERASVLTPAMLAALKGMDIAANSKSRGMIYNAQMVDVSRLLSLVPVHVAATTAPAAAIPQPVTPAEVAQPAPVAQPTDDLTLAVDEPIVAALSAEAAPSIPKISSEAPALLLFVLDRSVADPYGGDLQNAFSRLQRQLGETLSTIAKRGGGCVDVGVVSYGQDSAGEVEVRTTLDGGLAGRNFARDNELLEQAVRVDEIEEEISDGVGGIILVPRRLPTLVEIEATPAASPLTAFQAARDLVTTWRGEHANSEFPPMVIHLTRGKQDAQDLDSSLQLMQDVTGLLLFHLVASEDAQPSLVYPTAAAEIEDPILTTLRSYSSQIPTWPQLAEKHSLLTADSRGIVVNGKFELLWDMLQAAKSAS